MACGPTLRLLANVSRSYILIWPSSILVSSIHEKFGSRLSHFHQKYHSYFCKPTVTAYLSNNSNHWPLSPTSKPHLLASAWGNPLIEIGIYRTLLLAPRELELVFGNKNDQQDFDHPGRKETPRASKLTHPEGQRFDTRTRLASQEGCAQRNVLTIVLYLHLPDELVLIGLRRGGIAFLLEAPWVEILRVCVVVCIPGNLGRWNGEEGPRGQFCAVR